MVNEPYELLADGGGWKRGRGLGRLAPPPRMRRGTSLGQHIAAGSVGEKQPAPIDATITTASKCRHTHRRTSAGRAAEWPCGSRWLFCAYSPDHPHGQTEV